MGYFDVFELHVVNSDLIQRERNLYASVLSLALRDALVMSISEGACRTREWWTSQEYRQDIETFCEVLSLNSKKVVDSVKKIIKEQLIKNFIKLEEQRILKIEREDPGEQVPVIPYERY